MSQHDTIHQCSCLCKSEGGLTLFKTKAKDTLHHSGNRNLQWIYGSAHFGVWVIVGINQQCLMQHIQLVTNWIETVLMLGP